MAVFNTIISMGATVMMPIIFFLVGLVFKVGPAKSFKAGMTVGIGFTGINLVVGLLIQSLGPAAQDMVTRFGLELNVVDVGWATSAAMGWSSPLIPFIVAGAILLNVVLLVINKTKIINIDIFNYWLISLVGAFVYANTDSMVLGVVAALLSYLIAFIIGDLTAKPIQEMYNIKGVAFVHVTCGAFVPIGIAVNWIIERIPGLNKIDLNPEKITKTLGVIGEPLTLATILGGGLGILAGWSIEQILPLAVNVAAVMLILPKMVELTVDGVMIIRDAAEQYMQKMFPGREFYFGMDTALLIGEPCIIATSLLLIPSAIILAMILPGNKMLPFADLSAVVFLISMVAPFCKRNMFRIYITGLVILSLCLYGSTDQSKTYTDIAVGSHIVEQVEGQEYGNISATYNSPIGWSIIKISELIGD
ncbi:PTS galactitol transporter subunit IIC [Chakrabartyella piscis]|uniref:PTS galactitol transporter subunit IIC n=1 Tax=Chakrabartyella piscis TaxID=2918914 RepID=UPI002958AEDD|nr:PTS transporter subunit IIC [Chakrabartyella piscis]